MNWCMNTLYKNSALKSLGLSYVHSYEMKLFAVALVSLFGSKAMLMLKKRECQNKNRLLKMARQLSDREESSNEDSENEERI